MKDHEVTVDQLTHVVAATISLDDVQQGLRNGRRIGYITILATMFIPPSFFASLLSMTDGPIPKLEHAFKLWAATSLPVLALLFLVFWMNRLFFS